MSSFAVRKLTIPGLLEFQRASYFQFLRDGLRDEMLRRQVISTRLRGGRKERSSRSMPRGDKRETTVALTFYPECYRLEPPLRSYQEALRLGTSYTARLLLPVSLRDEQTSQMRFEWVPLGTLPILTRQGHFLVNGSPRVMVSQLVRGPGLYCGVRQDNFGNDIYFTDLVPERGAWARIELDEQNMLWLRMRRCPRLPMLLVLQAIGVPWSRLVHSFSPADLKSSMLPFSRNRNDDGSLSFRGEEAPEREDPRSILANVLVHPTTRLGALTLLARLVQSQERVNRKEVNPDPIQWNWDEEAKRGKKSKKGDGDHEEERGSRPTLVGGTPALPGVAVRFLIRKLGSLRTYDLGDRGRRRLNERLGVQIPLTQHALTPSDLLGATLQLFERKAGRRRLDDVDSLATRRIRGVGDLLRAEMSLATLRLERRIVQRLELFDPFQIPMLRQLIPTEPMDQAFRLLFGKNPLSQFADQLNPLADVTHKRRLTRLGPGGLGLDNAKLEVRSIHPSHYGRLCPVETPEGQNAGLVNSPTLLTRVGSDGRLYAALLQISQGKREPETKLIAPQEQGWARLATGRLPNENLRLSAGSILTRVEGRQYGIHSSNEVDLIAAGPLQTLALGPNLIPFLEHDDGNRVLMGANMLRQALPLLQPQAPRVTTGLDSYPVIDTSHLLRARWSGYVSYVSAHRIVIQSLIEPGRVVRHHLPNRRLVPSTGTNPWQFRRNSSRPSPEAMPKREASRLPNQSYLCSIEYRVGGTHRTNQSTWRRQRPVVQEGQWIEAGELLADGAASHAGELAVGHNLLVAYTPWDGLNFEDAMVVSERLVREDLATTTHVDEYEVEIGLTRFGFERFEGYSRELLASVKGFKRDVERTNPLEEDPSRLFPGWEELDERGLVRPGTWVEPGQILALRVRPMAARSLTPYERLMFDVLDLEPPTRLNTSLRVPAEVYGRVLEVQVFPPDPSLELEAGLKFGEAPTIGRVRIVVAARRRLQIGDKLAGRHGNKGIISRIVSRADLPYLIDGSPVDLVLNPLGVPSRMNVGQVYEALLSLAGRWLGERYRVPTFDERSSVPMASRTLALQKLAEARQSTGKWWRLDPTVPGKMPVFDGRTGEAFEQDIAVGEAYILKLVHMVDDKMHARATGPYSLVTQQPVRGRARKGGQRVGEMEMWALEGFGAAYTLQELLTIKSDDVSGRGSVLTEALLENRPLAVDLPDTFRVLARELQALCLEVTAYGMRKNRGTQLRDLRTRDGLNSLSRYVLPDALSQELLKHLLSFLCFPMKNSSPPFEGEGFFPGPKPGMESSPSSRPLGSGPTPSSWDPSLPPRRGTAGSSPGGPPPGPLPRKKRMRPGSSSEREMWQMPVSQVRVRAASPQHIRHLSLRQMPEGPLVGRIWSARTVDYKTLKPYPGGLFCESVFGPVQKGICACGRTRLEAKWRPTMVRQVIQRCPLCREETCSWRPRRDGTLAQIPTACPCGSTQPREVEYRTVRRVCVQCGGRTRDPIPPSLERDYQPGLCPCGKTTTEVASDDPIFCGYCGTEITLDPMARRYRLGYLPLATPVAHPWYYRGQPHFLGPLLGFSRRKLDSLLKCEGGLANGLQLRIGFSTFSRTPKDFVPAERLARVDEPLERRKGRRLRRRRLVSPPPPPPRRQARELRLVQHLVFAFPWYCLYRDSLWRPIPSTNRLENGGRDLDGLAALTNYLLPEIWPGDRLLGTYRRLHGIESRLLSDHNARTGGDVLLERLQEMDPIRWVTHARRALRMLDQEIAWFEGRPLRKNETIEYRRRLRQRGRLLRRLRIFAELRVSNVQPSWLMLQCIPILPADLRPAIPMGNGLVMVSDVNKLYQRVVSRNSLVAEIRRETTVQENASYRGDLRYAQRLLQEGVDALIENGRGGAKPETDARGRRLKSLAETLKGKRGRFRRNLLGKRVDYSGRSVIVSGPELSLHQCGLPRQMALVLLQPFLLRSLVGKVIDGRLLRTRWMARECLDNPTSSVWMEVMRAAASLPILLNRAPTLHRMGFQAFQPRIISGRAILLHPLTCSGFNADFDGDQMAVHIPLSSRARAEAWRLMTPGRHFFSPATGEAGFLPSQDMVLGAYYLTTSNTIMWKKFLGKERHFPSLIEVEDAYEQKEIHLHEPIWLKQAQEVDTDRLDPKTGTEPLEWRLHPDGSRVEVQAHRHRTFTGDGLRIHQYVRTTVGRALLRHAVEQSVQIGTIISSLFSFLISCNRKRRFSSIEAWIKVA